MGRQRERERERERERGMIRFNTPGSRMGWRWGVGKLGSWGAGRGKKLSFFSRLPTVTPHFPRIHVVSE